jgi:hypothetical protein
MANIANKFGLGGGGGINFTDPRQLQRSTALAGNIVIADSALSQPGSTAAGYFTEIALRGFADNTNWTADTYKTLLSVTSGSGLLSHLVGPTALGSAPTTTFDITVDGGTAYEIAVTATASGQRAVIGPAVGPALFTTAAEYLRGPSAVDTNRMVDVVGGTYIPAWPAIRLMPIPCLEFKLSLLVRAKSSENNSTTTNQERQSGGQYKRFT